MPAETKHILKDTTVHRQLEDLTESIYQTPGMLPAKYTFILTNRCNLSCSFCFMEKKKLNYEMTKEDWIHVANQVPEYARVSLTGGEPLLFKDFDVVFKTVAQQNVVSIITNGVLLTEQLMKMMASYDNFKVLSISIDSIGNKVRNMSTSDWEKLLGNIKIFKSLKHDGCKIDLKTTILDENAEDLFRIHRFCVESLGCDTHAFQLLKGSPLQHADKMYAPNDMNQKYSAYVYEKWNTIMAQLESVREYSVKNGNNTFILPKIADLNSNLPLPDISFINQSDYRKSEYKACKYPWSSIYINSDGHVIPCLAISVGDITRMSLKEIVEGSSFESFKEKINAYGTVPACNRCCWMKSTLNPI